MKKTNPTQSDLAAQVADLQLRLKKKTEDLTRTRQRLNRARNSISRLKRIVQYQRERIIKLYS